MWMPTQPPSPMAAPGTVRHAAATRHAQRISSAESSFHSFLLIISVEPGAGPHAVLSCPHSPLFNSCVPRLLQRRAGPPAARLPAAVPEPRVGARLGRRHPVSRWLHRHRRACKPAAFLAWLAAALAPLCSGLLAGHQRVALTFHHQCAEGGLSFLPAGNAMQCRTVRKLAALHHRLRCCPPCASLLACRRLCVAQAGAGGGVRPGHHAPSVRPSR